MPTPPLLALLFVQLLFAVNAVLAKVVMNAGVDPLAVAAVRVLLCAVLLCALFLRLAPERVSGRDWALLGLLSLLGVVVNQVLFLSGLARTSAIDAMLLIATIPVFTLVVAVAARRERFDAPRAFGVGVALAGALVLLRAEEFGGGHALGNLMVLANSLSYSFYLVLSRGILQRMASPFVVAATFALGALPMVPLGTPGLARLAQAGGLDAAVLWAWTGVVVATVGAYALNNHALKRVRASTVATFTFLQPVFATFLALWWLPEERVTARTVVAGVLILAGILLVAHREHRTRKPLSRSPGSMPRGRPEPQPQEDRA